jgi:uncharacterized protein
MIAPRLTLVTLGVEDLGRSVAFYEALGWRRSSAGGEGVAFFQLGGMALSLFPREDLAKDAGVAGDGAGFRGFALAHNTESRETADAAMAAALAAGATVVKPMQEAFWGGYSGYFADPDGVLWEIAHNPFFDLSPDGALILPA